MKDEIRKYTKVAREIRNTWPLFQYRNHARNKESSFRSLSDSKKLNADCCSEGHMAVFFNIARNYQTKSNVNIFLDRTPSCFMYN